MLLVFVYFYVSVYKVRTRLFVLNTLRRCCRFTDSPLFSFPRSLGYRSHFSQTMAGHIVIIESLHCQTVWEQQQKESISRTYMNVYGLLNCFRHTVRWALRFSKSHTASQGQEGKLLHHSPALSITPPHWLVKCLLKTEANSAARTCAPPSNS